VISRARDHRRSCATKAASARGAAATTLRVEAQARYCASMCGNKSVCGGHVVNARGSGVHSAQGETQGVLANDCEMVADSSPAVACTHTCATSFESALTCGVTPWVYPALILAVRLEQGCWPSASRAGHGRAVMMALAARVSGSAAPAAVTHGVAAAGVTHAGHGAGSGHCRGVKLPDVSTCRMAACFTAAW
jgi:hypothetical protein